MIRLMRLGILLGKCWWVVKVKNRAPCFAKNSRLLDGGVALTLVGWQVVGANSSGDTASNRVHKLRIG